jgi:hypothetical protein
MIELIMYIVDQYVPLLVVVGGRFCTCMGRWALAPMHVPLVQLSRTMHGSIQVLCHGKGNIL